MKAVPRALATRATLYLRQSTYREESISLELQEAAGRDYCARMGYSVVAVEADPGVSGRTFNRPAVQRVMDAIESGDTDVVVLWKWSRLSRSRLDWAIAVDRIESFGGRLESATEPSDTATSAGRFQRGVLAEVAAMESERIGEVWKETIDRRVRQGLPGTGGDRYGYIRVDKNTYTPDPATAPVIVEAYEHYLRDEWGWTRLTRWLNESGHTTITGSLWSPDKIRAVMDAGFAAGKLATGYRSGQLSYHPGAHEPLISQDIWERYLERRALAPRPARQVEARTPLSGLLVCDDCGGTMRSRRRNGAQGYACGNYLRFRQGRLVTCSRSAVEDHVRNWVMQLASEVDAYASAQAQLVERRARAINDASAIDSRIRKLHGDLGVLTVRFGENKISERAYAAAAEKIEGDIRSLQARQRVASASTREQVDARTIAMHLAERWDDMTPQELRTMLSKLIGEVRVIPPAVKKIGGTGPVTYRIRTRWQEVT